MVVILEEDRSSPVVAMQAMVKTGSANEAGLMGAGISHYVEHMLFKGTKKRSVGDVAEEIRNAGGNLNGFTSFEYTGYPVVVSSSFFDTGLDVLSDVLMNSSFDPVECEKERDVILKEINMNDDSPSRCLSNMFFSTAYRVHPYGVPIIGYKEVFNRITRDELVAYYKKHYIPNNVVFVMVGDFDKAEAFEKIKNAFNPWQRKPLLVLNSPAEPKQLMPRYKEKTFPAEITRMDMGFAGVAIDDPDLFAIDTLATILGGGPSSRLVESLKNVRGLVYSIYCSSYTPKDTGVISIYASMEDKKLKTVICEIWEELEKIKSGPLEEGELDKAKKIALANYFFERETMEDKAMCLANDEVIGGNYLFSECYVSGISSVTAEDIQKAAQKYFKKEKEVTCVLRPLDSAGKEDFKKAEQTENVTTKKTLANGVTLILRATRQSPTVFIQALLAGGVRFEDDKNNGIFNFLHKLLDKGTKSKTAAEIAKEIDHMGADFESYGGSNSFGCSIKVLKEDAQKGISLLSELLLNSTFPEEECNKARENIKGDIKSQEEDLIFVARKKLNKALFDKHPYSLLSTGTLESIGNISRKDLLKLKEDFFVPSNMVFSICGDFNEEEIIKTAEDALCKLTTKENKIPVNTYKECIYPKTSESFFIPKEKKQTVLLLGYPGMSVTAPERYTMEVITTILSGMGGRLFSHVRDELGLVYYVGSYNQMGTDRGSYTFYLGTTPENVDIARNAVLEEINKICTEPVSDEELDRTKKTLVGNRRISWQRNSSHAFEIAIDELYGLGYKTAYKYEENIMSVNKADITEIAKKYFTLPYIEVSAGAKPEQTQTER